MAADWIYGGPSDRTAVGETDYCGNITYANPWLFIYGAAGMYSYDNVDQQSRTRFPTFPLDPHFVQGPYEGAINGEDRFDST